jgi:hypothetical protein
MIKALFLKNFFQIFVFVLLGIALNLFQKIYFNFLQNSIAARLELDFTSDWTFSLTFFPL